MVSRWEVTWEWFLGRSCWQHLYGDEGGECKRTAGMGSTLVEALGRTPLWVEERL